MFFACTGLQAKNILFVRQMHIFQILYVSLGMKKFLHLLVLAALLLCSCARTPVIGISSGSDGAYDSVKRTYTVAVRKAGGIPVILPRVYCEKQALELLQSIDGLVMTGGEDYDPAWYGEQVLNSSVKVNAPRDTSDLLLIRAALDLGKPVLGICRGMQGVNVALGGTLYQDIPSQIQQDTSARASGSCFRQDTSARASGISHRQDTSAQASRISHRQDTSANVATHNVVLAAGSVLHSLLGGADTIRVNSFHHQAVKDPAPGLTVVGFSPDGVAEALEGDGILATQFHPEAFIASGDDFFLPLFRELIRRASRH